MSDSRRFIFFAEGKAHVADAFTKRVRAVFNLEQGQEQVRSLGIADDDSLLYFSVYESESDIWLLDLQR
jgi:hypothetical protein